MTARNRQTKFAVSVSEMAKMVGLSRARFYQLVGAGTFPEPSHDPETRRPYFDEGQQAVCLDVRRRNCGVDGKPVLFYARRAQVRPAPAQPRTTTESKTHSDTHDKHLDILEAVKALGLTTATIADVRAAVNETYPGGVAGIDEGEVLRTVFLKLKGRNKDDNLRRLVPFPGWQTPSPV